MYDADFNHIKSIFSPYFLRKKWATGAVTSTLLGLQTLATITQSGIWEFMDESRHRLGPELMTQVNSSTVRHRDNICLSTNQMTRFKKLAYYTGKLRALSQ